MSEYTVKAGDSLSTIAQRELGNVSLWPKIATLNHIQAPYVIRVGEVLILPTTNTLHTIDVPAKPVPVSSASSTSSTSSASSASSSAGLVGRLFAWTKAHPGLAAVYGLSIAASVVGLWWYSSNPRASGSGNAKRRRRRRRKSKGGDHD